MESNTYIHGLENNILRLIVQDSWNRCWSYRLDPSYLPAQELPDCNKILSLFNTNKFLINSSSKILNDLSESISVFNHWIGLFDNEGVLLYHNLDSRIEDSHPMQSNVFVGACWNEEHMGTTAVGASLEAKCPVIINKEEHYFNLLKNYSCFAVPIHNLNGAILGIMGIALIDSQVTGEIYQKAIDAVKNIESALYPNFNSHEDYKDNFFSEIVHESRNALTACEGFIQLMLVKKVFNSEHLEIILSELRRTITILNSYAFVSTPQDHTKYHNINDSIKDLCILLSSKFEMNSINLVLSLSDIPQVLIDPSKFKQVVLNLLENAVDAIEEDGDIHIATAWDNNLITMTISDTGPGIDDSLKDKVFTPFFTTKSKGTGLGLHVCKTIIEQYNGSIVLKSEKGVGTTFTINLPVKG